MCEYCENQPLVIWEDSDSEVYLNKNNLVVMQYLIELNSLNAIEINFCPMCGRKLQEQAE